MLKNEKKNASLHMIMIYLQKIYLVQKKKNKELVKKSDTFG